MPENAPDQDARELVQPRIRRAWYVACVSTELRKKPLAFTIFETPIVLFRDSSGQANALMDRCPHRNVPLSIGKVVDGRLACGYHGWQFSGDGRCVHIPAYTGEPDRPARRCGAFPVIEQQGFVWVWPDRSGPPEGPPFEMRYADAPGYLTVRKALPAQASIHAVAENALDVPHTAFLHRGLFRSDTPNRAPITCRIKRWHDRVECEYIGESRPTGLVGRILSPSGGTVIHFDRFYLPSIVEVEYRIGDENHIVLNGAITPVSDHESVLHACVAVRARIPLWLVRPFVEMAALRIFGQDQRLLEIQTNALRRFGEARYASTEIDVLGPHILRLMRQAARGTPAPPDGQPYTRDVTMLV
ncbi:MAG: aromatic ring-hydroxylating dioxygenase subunit alpha [Myxococcota bacterium]